MDQSSSSSSIPSSSNLYRIFNEVPRLSKTIAAVLAFFLFLGVFLTPYTITLFSINVAYVAPPYFFIWTLFTSGIYDIYLLRGLINIILLMISGKYLEPIWGSTEFLRFIAIVNTLSGVCCFFLYLIIYSIFVSDENLLYHTYICGFGGVIAAFTVALKQMSPEQEIPIFFSFTVRAKYLPSASLLISSVLYLIGLQSNSYAHVLFGTLISWVYLRFYQIKGGVKGDLSESFSFASFFPDVIQPPIKTISNIIFKILCKLRVCSLDRDRRGGSESILPTHHSYSGVTGTTADDVDRRRALAMKALEQRMSLQQQQQQQTQLPTSNTAGNVVIDT